ncbi:MAG: hypothetical protein D6705_10200 [Deltaproteobacteria bacterium]|nr:MAG: hypothetical protein D6705_10200 [Deltaproteobacteria bacterium]
MRHGARLGVLLSVVVAVGPGCGEAPSGPARPSPAPDDGTVQSVPADASGFLAELLPSVGHDLLVVYRLEGPEGISGSLEIMTRPGGWRRENWTVRIPVEGQGEVVREGTVRIGPNGVVVTPPDGGAPAAYRLPFGDWARAFAAAPYERRRRIVDALRAFAEQVADARRQHPGMRRTVAGIDCLALRVAAQSLCMWEEAGLPLRYEGPLLAAEAVRVDRAPDLAEGAFDLPTIPPTAAAAEGFEDLVARPVAEVLDALAEGDPDVLSRVAVSGFRPPTGLVDAGG